MYGYMSGWGWFWMSFMMALWLVLLGAVIYCVVNFANRESNDRSDNKAATGGDGRVAPR